MKRSIKGMLPWGIWRHFHVAAYGLRNYPKLYGVTARECPICGYQGRFTAAGDPPRFDARCPSCGSLERHRLLFLASKELGVFSRGSVLHFAPESNVRAFVKPTANDYVTADLEVGRADLALNIEDTGLPDASFDWILASHVLEHVDDKRALREIHRLLRLGGCLIVMVPIIEGWETTYENPDIRDEIGRELHFGQSDHVRFYGRDLRKRIRDAGFVLEEYTASPQDCVAFGLCRGERIFICRKGG